MGRIYKNAASVIAYLGPAANDEEERNGLDLLMRLDIHYSPICEKLNQMGHTAAALRKVSELLVPRLPDGLAASELAVAGRVVLRAVDNPALDYAGTGTEHGKIHATRGSTALLGDRCSIAYALYLQIIPCKHVYKSQEEISGLHKFTPNGISVTLTTITATKHQGNSPGNSPSNRCSLICCLLGFGCIVILET
jgi:hypothetical protein